MKLPKFKIGDKVRLTKSALEAWVASDFYTDGIKAGIFEK